MSKVDGNPSDRALDPLQRLRDGHWNIVKLSSMHFVIYMLDSRTSDFRKRVTVLPAED